MGGSSRDMGEEKTICKRVCVEFGRVRTGVGPIRAGPRCSGCVETTVKGKVIIKIEIEKELNKR